MRQPKTISINGITVKLEQIADSNSHGNIYRLSSSIGHLNYKGWCYGRGDTRCIEILEGIRDFKPLAIDFLKWQITELQKLFCTAQAGIIEG